MKIVGQYTRIYSVFPIILGNSILDCHRAYSQCFRQSGFGHSTLFVDRFGLCCAKWQTKCFAVLGSDRPGILPPRLAKVLFGRQIRHSKFGKSRVLRRVSSKRSTQKRHANRQSNKSNDTAGPAYANLRS